MFENLTDKLERSFKLIKGEGRITEINVAETLQGGPPGADRRRRQLQGSQILHRRGEAEEPLGQDVLKSVKPGQMITKIVRDELAQLMGGTATDIKLEGTPAVILIAGLQGPVRLPSPGKLAAMLKGAVAGARCCSWRATSIVREAIDALKVLGGQIGVKVSYGRGE